MNRDLDYEWHYKLNDYNTIGNGNFNHWMYEAKRGASEIERMQRQFKAERLGELPKIHKQCSMSAPVEVKENYLTCCIGERCSECPYLKAVSKAKATPEEIDFIKSWTCLAHILSKPNHEIDTSEGYLLTVDDRMYWQNVYQSLSSEPTPAASESEAKE